MKTENTKHLITTFLLALGMALVLTACETQSDPASSHGGHGSSEHHH